MLKTRPQTAFLKAFQHLRDFEGHARFGTWLTRIAINEGLECVRTRKPMESLFLERIPELAELCFFVDPLGQAASAANSYAGLRAAHLWVRNGGALVMFSGRRGRTRTRTGSVPHRVAVASHRWPDRACDGRSGGAGVHCGREHEGLLCSWTCLPGAAYCVACARVPAQARRERRRSPGSGAVNPRRYRDSERCQGCEPVDPAGGRTTRADGPLACRE